MSRTLTPTPASTASLWTTAEAVRATGGRADGAWAASGVSIDSRSVAPGDLFVALQGPTFDGHDYVAAALAAGAVAAVVARVPEGDGIDPARLLVVGDTFQALWDLGRFARSRARDVRVVGVTGSVGKTGTKEMLALALGALGPTHATTGNLNNHWGVPLTLARMPAATRFAVIEMGMNHAGEIAPLSTLARPDVAVITAIAPAHIEFLGSEEAIAHAKAEILTGLAEGGTVILPRDSRHFRRLRAAARAAGAGRVVSFGDHVEADARLLDVALDPGNVRVFMVADGAPLGYRLGADGRHWAINSLAVIAAVQALGADPVAVLGALGQVSAPKGRGQRRTVALPGGRLHLIDESYNASPAAVVAAVATLALVRPGAGGRRVAVLGDMLELGDAGPDLHAGLAAALIDHGIDQVFTAGPLMRHLDAALPDTLRAGHASDALTLAPMVADALGPGDVVMVKGSLGSRMSAVVRAILALEVGDQGEAHKDEDETAA
ncbi:UDP-N-acetylmuramoyl-tripeptide--D-alanyl-D-alanine ligase [Roseospira marina]|uniref:UDP-N-acetylmuramoyl-tripeptide--D-alanyl-D-alanine ligase n=1 Tax=Roseospira marina TaxID=140057 RepID=A0A5M6I8J4_9PROT|nr:UDP-N-acetylmuramoyl-tripeptide--D-alanyl-D-alanine ligase [Roseospira marina]KAA5604570.1 UDP-N-acetylmuramoyl-tripeptide--D-alanyl-D-alanine ligase [Roseospira marina]MBB4315318.1 UDP-N-acetylmuramoyl-tripeptide--D-alanyl-D-alanine ligase [Roseospira marina]MBB5088317.1 UDP-N-acetylmuramoyl-tripeptide--D-alanyl-D-alanine ligase [Roseospira marina]